MEGVGSDLHRLGSDEALQPDGQGQQQAGRMASCGVVGCVLDERVAELIAGPAVHPALEKAHAIGTELQVPPPARL
jgi:hypothetical protein